MVRGEGELRELWAGGGCKGKSYELRAVRAGL